MEDNKTTWRKIGNRIALMRISRRLTQYQLAEMTGLSLSYIGFIEQGIRKGTILTYYEIVTALGYSLNDLVDIQRTEIPPELALELSDLLTACRSNEKEAIVGIFREMLGMIRMIRREAP